MNTPTHKNPVLAWDGAEWIRAQWVKKYSLEVSMAEDYAGEYSEADGQYYWQEGWYELVSHGRDDVTYWQIQETVTAWQELPPAPGETK